MRTFFFSFIKYIRIAFLTDRYFKFILVKVRNGHVLAADSILNLSFNLSRFGVKSNIASNELFY